MNEIEELKARAKELGYNLIKIPEKVVLEPCICGAKKSRYMVYNSRSRNRYLKCQNCGFEGNESNSERGAKIGWNDAVREYMTNMNKSED